MESNVSIEAKSIDRKRQEAIAYLGDRYSLSPNYRPELNAHHDRSFKRSAVLAGFASQNNPLLTGSF